MSNHDNEPPPGPKPDAVPPETAHGPRDRNVRLEGTVQLFVQNMPEASFVDLTSNGTHPVFACCWIDRHRGASTRVSFTPGVGLGTFRLQLDLRDGDTDKLKIQMYMRMQDPDTGNRRTVQLSTSCVHLTRMLDGGTDELRMPDQFAENNFINVSMRVSNHQEFLSQPLRLKSSALDRLPEFNKHVRQVSEAMEANNRLNKTQFAKGADSMRSGDSRCLLPPSPLLYLALALGTPAYCFLLCWQP